MQPEQPSRTAMSVAIRRAAHQVFHRPPVLDDPMALEIIGPEAAEEVRNTPQEQRNHPIHRAFRFVMAIRSRFAEDMLAEAVAHGVKQYVVLGAGLDTSAYRLFYPQVQMFEVDFPATQAWKRRKVAEAGLIPSESLTYAPIDFEHQTLGEGLAEAGFRADQPAFFSWLGVVPYLTESAAMATLSFLAAMPPGSGVVFDYAIPPDLLPEPERLALAELARRVASAGEPFRLYLDPQKIEQDLRRLGFHRTEQLDSSGMNARYLCDRSDGFTLRGRAARLMAAWV
jgi:methyltransferase (TIGR00027 family)